MGKNRARTKEETTLSADVISGTTKVMMLPKFRRQVNRLEICALNVWSYARMNSGSLSAELHQLKIREMVLRAIEEYEAEAEAAYADCLELLEKVPEQHRPTIPERFYCGGSSARKRLTAEMAKEIKLLRQKGRTIESIAKELHLTKAAVINVVSGKQYPQVQIDKG